MSPANKQQYWAPLDMRNGNYIISQRRYDGETELRLHRCVESQSNKKNSDIFIEAFNLLSSLSLQSPVGRMCLKPIEPSAVALQ